MATLCYNLFGYFPAPFVFGGVADRDKSDPVGSMRFAMGTITYWSILAAVFLLTATLIKFRKKRGTNNETKALDKNSLALMDGAGEYERMGKQSPINGNRTSKPIVVRPEDALSSHLGDSQISPNNSTMQQHRQQNAALINRNILATNKSATSDDS